jgi:hypothetical protein
LEGEEAGLGTVTWTVDQARDGFSVRSVVERVDEGVKVVLVQAEFVLEAKRVTWVSSDTRIVAGQKWLIYPID